VPLRLDLNTWALGGEWTIGPETAALNAADGRIAFRFHARDLHLVMGSPRPGDAIRFRITLDGEAPGDARGGDTDAAGEGVAAEQRLYQLIRQPGRVVDRTAQITFLDPGVEVFVFTFG
ncbi:MAG: cytochrome c biogenesis protein DipZ, partial [Candidatus Dormibacteraeota bacterium]|nr:cytochrome c biogenesis protein DipZ [Candidatus Dormibacteraeota bacterium]